MHPVLTPGTHVLRRGPRESQVGLAAGSAVLAGPPPDPAALGDDPPLLGRLCSAGLAAADDRALREALPGHKADPGLRHCDAALARRATDGLGEVLRRRGSTRVTVTRFGHPVGELLVAELTELCRRTGLFAATAQRARARAASRLPVRVLVGVGEPTRELVDPWLRDGTPHLLVRLTEGRAVVGPFVLPGRTACLRCLDAYRREEDPVWPLLVEQYARATRADRVDGIPEPLDAALAAVAVGWAARDVASYAEGATPSTLGATVTFSPLLESVSRQEWRQHPHCGCAW